MRPILPPASDRNATPSRSMTRAEIDMARAVSCCPLLKHSKHRPSMRLLHARAIGRDPYITAHEAETLRAIVIAFAAKLDEHVVKLARGGVS